MQVGDNEALVCVKNNMLVLPVEEGNRLIYYFLAECGINVVQALQDNLGNKEVDRLSEPFAHLAAKAYVLNRLQENRFPGLLENKDSVLTIGVFHQHLFRTIFGGKCENMIITDRGLTFTISDLQPSDLLLVLFTTPFGHDPGIMEVIDPQYELTARSIPSKGSSLTQILIKKKDDSVTEIGNEGSPRLCISQLRIGADEEDFWRRHYWGEFWGQTSGILFEELGETRASYIIEPYMKQIGHFYGDYFKNRFELGSKNPQGVGEVIQLFNRLLKQEGNIVKNEDNILSYEISSCPFSKSSPFICKQMSMIHNSLCQTINEDILFEYDNGLMKGEKSCHWVVRKKNA